MTLLFQQISDEITEITKELEIIDQQDEGFVSISFIKTLFICLGKVNVLVGVSQGKSMGETVFKTWENLH